VPMRRRQGAAMKGSEYVVLLRYSTTMGVYLHRHTRRGQAALIAAIIVLRSVGPQPLNALVINVILARQRILENRVQLLL
jgi:hypothetical protein